MIKDNPNQYLKHMRIHIMSFVMVVLGKIAASSLAFYGLFIVIEKVAKALGKEIFTQAVSNFLNKCNGIAPIMAFISAGLILLVIYFTNPLFSAYPLDYPQYANLMAIPYSMLILSIGTMALNDLKKRR